MPLLGLFRSKDEKLVDALAEVYSKVFMAALASNLSLETALKEQWNTRLEPSVDYALRCELYCFYAHVLDFFSFLTLGEKGRDFVMDQLVPIGIEPFVHSSWPGAGDEVWETLIANLLERVNIITLDYARSNGVFVSDMHAVLQRGGVPGVNDAFSDQPEAKVSRLIQNINRVLNNDLPELEMKSELALEGAEAFGTSPKAMGFVLLCAVIQNTVYLEWTKAKLMKTIRKMIPLIR